MGKRDDDAREELKTLRQEYTDLERRSTAQQECLSRAVGTLARILESDEQISAQIAGVKEAVETVFDVEVMAVNTMVMKPKRRQLGRKTIQTRPAWKRAVVTLAPGERIQDFFEGI